jgi:hypothetical protein|nr:MAG TPA: hypothetical protein [Caudoviricetes sp.]
METIFKESLFDYDGPFLFIVQSGSDQYMAVKIRQNDIYKYIVVPVLEQQIREAKMGKKSVDDIFMASDSWFIGHFTSGRLHFELEKQESPISVLSKYFDGTFYLDPEDYEDDLCSLDYKFIWIAGESLNTEQIKLNICDSILKNHRNNQWVKEDLLVTRVERIPSQVYSPGISRYFGMKKSQKEIKFSCSDLYTKETQQIDYDYNNAA